ncbi:universal stress protein [Halorubrum vacuolatum]|nr:universal stress protein [Halorubrum vacuolatum]
MIDKILIATDGSDASSGAFEYGLELAKSFDAEVHLIYVVETEASYILTVIGDDEMEEYRAYGEEVVSDGIAHVEEAGLEGVGVVKTGKVASEIVSYAEDNDVDTVVLGERGRGAIERYLGSTAEKVVRMCSKPVTVVRP